MEKNDRVSVTFKVADQHMEALDLSCGLVCVPHDGTMVVAGSGTPKEVLEMVLAVIALADERGLHDPLRLLLMADDLGEIEVLR